jgi:hypothetical protein
LKKLFRRTAVVACLVAGLVPAAAQAGPFAPLQHVTTGGAFFDDGTNKAFALVVTNYSPSANSHLIAGTLGSSGAFAGALYLHDFDRKTNSGHYLLDASLVNGADLLADAIVHYDREGKAKTIELDGSLAGQSFSTGALKIT